MTGSQQALPAGIVTFLFTDIKGSTRLWERDRDAMWRALARHNTILGEAIRAHGGHHVKTVGDAFQAVFAAAGVLLFGAAERLRETIGAPIPPFELGRYQAGIDAVRAGLDAERFAALWQEGRDLPLDNAAAEALRVAGKIAKARETDAAFAQERRSAAATSQ